MSDYIQKKEKKNKALIKMNSAETGTYKIKQNRTTRG